MPRWCHLAEDIRHLRFFECGGRRVFGNREQVAGCAHPTQVWRGEHVADVGSRRRWTVARPLFSGLSVSIISIRSPVRVRRREQMAKDG